jgi:hypothetical protein
MCSQTMSGPVGVRPADLGKFRVGRWIKANEVMLPRVCMACGAEPAFRSMELGGSDAKGKYWVRLQMPLCDHCAEVHDSCAHFMGTRGKPREVKQEFKQIGRAAKMKVHRSFSGDLAVNLTFRNRTFYEAFMAANPVPEKHHRGRS